MLLTQWLSRFSLSPTRRRPQVQYLFRQTGQMDVLGHRLSLNRPDAETQSSVFGNKFKNRLKIIDFVRINGLSQIRRNAMDEFCR